MDKINQIVAKNLINLRKKAELTQAELAEKLNYSDKSISKWETGEAAPSIEVLAHLSELFGVGVETFLSTEPKNVPLPEKKQPKNKIVVTLLSVSLVWFVALAVFTLMLVAFNVNLWSIFVWAVPATFIVTTVFSCLWSPKRHLKYVSVSCLVWSLVMAIYVQLLLENLWLIFVVAVPIQIAVILWAFRMKRAEQRIILQETKPNTENEIKN